MIGDLLRKSAQKLLDSTTLDERLSSGANKIRSSLQRNISSAANNFSPSNLSSMRSNISRTLIQPVSHPMVSSQNMNPQRSFNPLTNLDNVVKMQVGANVRNFVNESALNRATTRLDTSKIPFNKQLDYSQSQYMGMPREVSLGQRKPTAQEMGEVIANIGGLSGGMVASKKIVPMAKLSARSQKTVSVGVPGGNRTRINPLEGDQSNPLAYGDTSNIPQNVKSSQMPATNSLKQSLANPKIEKTPVIPQNKQPLVASRTVSGNGTLPTKTQTMLDQSQIQSSGQILPQRGFAKSVGENKKTPQDLSIELEKIRYNPLSNRETLNTAEKLIKRNESQALQLAKEGTDAESNAIALRLIEKYIDKGRFAEANELTKAVSPRFTKAGQEIQILSAYGRLTPTGAIRYAQSLINEANKANPRLKLQLTPENTKQITDAAKLIRKIPEGSRERTVAIAKLMQTVTDIIPPSFGQKISTIQTMAQLLNLKTAGRNIIGNTIFTGMENASDVVGTGIDKAVSLVTGQRSKVLPSLTAQTKGYVTGIKEGMEDVKYGINTAPGSTKFDLTGKTFTGGILGKLEKVMNVELRVPDRAAYTSAYEGSLNNQMRAAGVNVPTDQMREVAHADGLYRTFQDNSKLAQIFSGAKKLMNKVGTQDGKFGLGDFILKYPKTPANILSRGLDYSPVGYIKAVYEVARPLVSGKPFDQKQFVESLSRAMVGSGMIAAGYQLAKNGIITGKSDKDYDINAIQKTTGQGAFKINVDALKRYWQSGGQKQDAQNGDTLVSYDWAQPTSITLAIGANQALGGDNTSLINSAIENYQSAVDTITGQPMVKNLVDLASSVKNKGVVGALMGNVTDNLSGFVPSLVRQAANAFDKTQRNAYDPNTIKQSINRAKANVPGLRNTLQPKLDVFGKEMVNYEGGALKRLFDIFINPAFVSKVKENPAAKEVIDIYQRSGETKQAPRVAPEKVKIGGKTVAATPEQYTAYQRLIGTKTQEAYDRLIKTSAFMLAGDEKKAKMMADVLSDINTAAKKAIFSGSPSSITTYVKSKDAPSGVIDTIGTYGKSVITDPGQTIKAVLAGNPIRKVEGGAVILERKQGLGSMDNGNKATQVDHKIALTLGGTNDQSNLQTLTNEENQVKGAFETYLYKEMKAGRITKAEAQKRDLNWRNEVTNLPKVEQTKIVNTVAQNHAPMEVTLVSDSGTVKTVDLAEPITAPTYTNNKLYDKKLKSQYTSAISSRQKLIMQAAEDGQITVEQAIKMVQDLENQKVKKTGTGKALSSKKLKSQIAKLVKLTKFKEPKSLKSYMKSSSKPKLKKYTITKRPQ